MELVTTLASWFTPTTLFLLLNFTIGTIFFANRFGSGSGHANAPGPLGRPPSLIDRVKSINFHRYNSPSTESEIHFSGSDSHQNQPPSLLERVKSINVPYFKFPQHNSEGDYAAYALMTDETRRVDQNKDDVPTEPRFAVPSLLQRVKSIKLPSLYRSDPDANPEGDYAAYALMTDETRRVDQNKDDVPTEPRFAVPSLLQRVKSIKLPSLYRSDPDANSEEQKPERAKSESSKPVTKKKKKAATKKMMKSASVRAGVGYKDREEETVEAVEKRRPETTRVDRTTSIGEGEEGVDDKASDFINKFKQQLKLQRLDSFLRYREMLKNE